MIILYLVVVILLQNQEKEVTMYREGGTTKYIDEKGNEYFKDNRLGTKTKGKIFDKYPKEEDAKILDVELEILL